MEFRILIVDDQRLIARGYIPYLKKHDPQWIAEVASSGREAISKTDFFLPSVILMDYRMNDLDGIETSILIREKHPDIPIIMVSQEFDDEVFREALDAGIKGFVSKDSHESELVQAILDVAEGRFHLTGHILDIANERKKVHFNTVTKGIFTPREIEILRLIVDGHTSSSIGFMLNISKRTVETHRKNMLSKCNCKTTAAMIRYAIKNKLTS